MTNTALFFYTWLTILEKDIHGSHPGKILKTQQFYLLSRLMGAGKWEVLKLQLTWWVGFKRRIKTWAIEVSRPQPEQAAKSRTREGKKNPPNSFRTPAFHQRPQQVTPGKCLSLCQSALKQQTDRVLEKPDPFKVPLSAKWLCWGEKLHGCRKQTGEG